MKNHPYLIPLMFNQILCSLLDDGLSHLGCCPSLFLHLFSNSPKVLSHYHSTFTHCSTIVSSPLAFRLCSDYIYSKPTYFSQPTQHQELYTQANCNNTTTRVYNNDQINSPQDLFSECPEVYPYNHLTELTIIPHNNFNFQVLAIEDSISALLMNYYNSHDTNYLLDASCLMVLYKSQIKPNRLTMIHLTVEDGPNKLSEALNLAKTLSHTYLGALGYSPEYIGWNLSKLSESLNG